MDQRLAIVVFNLGGPDSPAAVRPFLFNLFNDPKIIALPQPFRWLIATAISRSRAEKSKGYYARLGGRSVLLDETRAQAQALEAAARALGSAAGPAAGDVRVFVFMRYWHPMAKEVVADLKAYDPTRIVVLPLYPQFSITTTATSFEVLEREARRQGLRTPMETLCCYPTVDGLVEPITATVRQAYEDASANGARPRVLFSAHGLPEATIARGDPYQWQVERTTAAIVERLKIKDLDWSICYQSRVGPMAWIGPSIETEITRAGSDKVPVILAPVAFVSEHVETLVELDETMRELAAAQGVPLYIRLPTVRTDGRFIGALAGLSEFLRGKATPCSETGARICPAKFTNCPARAS
ncbi:MAG: ferrochelatase [Rhodospirillaceae bacterium]